jgi:phage tail-like protein
MKCATPEELSYFSINTPGKWREGLSDSVFVDRDGRLSLGPTLNIDPSGEIGNAAGLAIDSKGDLFIIDAESCQIYRFNQKSQALQRLECFEGCGARGLFGCGSEHGQFKFKKGKIASGGLAFWNSMLYVADPFNHRVQSFYLPQFQIRLVLGKQDYCLPVSGDGAGEFNQPKDIITDRKGNFYVLDYGNRRIQKFNRFGKFLQFFGTKETDRAPEKPESLAIDKDNFIYILDSAKKTVEKFNAKGKWQSTVVRFKENPRPRQPSAIAVDENKIVYVGEKGNSDDLSIHEFDKNGTYLGHFGRYSKGCFKLVLDETGRLYASCGNAGDIFLFRGEDRFEKEGTFYSRIFDSTIESCQWHRLALDIEPAEKSNLTLSFRTSEKAFDIQEEETNIGWRKLFGTPDNSVAVNDALFPNAPGRYLQLRFKFSGDGSHTHRIRRAQIYFERLSYLRYLPATYQEDEEGKDFLERFLSIFESVSSEIEHEIAAVSRYFDPEAVRGEFLDWLGTWLAVLHDSNWPEEKRRELLKRASELYKIRGTMRGLQEIVQLFTGGKTVIIEHFRLQTPLVLGANSTLGISTVLAKGSIKRLVLEESSRIGEFALIDTDEPAEKPFEAHAFDFTILADTSKLKNDAQMQALRRLIEEEKPAHTRCFLRAGGGVMQLGAHALLGIDTKLSKGFETARLGINSQIGKGTFLGTKFRRRGVIGVRSTLTVDAILH